MAGPSSRTTSEPTHSGTWIDVYHPWLRGLIADTSSVGSTTAKTDPSAPGVGRIALMALGVFLIAGLVRLAVLQFGTGTDAASLGWFTDSFHHWQIAFLSKEIGFSAGFLRLWDFKGVEYFWGLLHPLTLALLFHMFGSVDILIPRLLGLFAGSISIAALFLLTRRYFNIAAALGVALLAALNPVAVISDTSGMQEPLGIMLLFLGLVAWPGQPVIAGLLLGIAGMARAEYWLFGAGLALAAILTEKTGYGKWGVALGWAIPSVLYMEYLWNYTGNPIYPVYWYFVGDATGAWIGTRQLLAHETAAMWISRLLLPIPVAPAIWVLVRKPRYSLLFLLGIGEFVFLCAVFGFSAFVRGFTTRLLIGRIFLLPHLYLGLFIAVFLLFWLPRKLKLRIVAVACTVAFLGVLVGLQTLWFPIMDEFARVRETWISRFEAADQIADLYTGHTISIPQSRPEFTYHLARQRAVPATAIVGQMYDPFDYLDVEAQQDRPTTHTAMEEWFLSNDIELIVVPADDQEYGLLIDEKPEWFSYQLDVLDGRYQVYRLSSADIKGSR